MGVFAITTRIKVLVSCLLLLVILDNVVNNFNNDKNVLSIRKLAKYAPKNIHPRDDDQDYIDSVSAFEQFDNIPQSKYSKNNVMNISVNPLELSTKNEIECTSAAPNQGGPITPNATLESLDIVEEELKPFLKPGGWFQPAHCRARDHVAIIVPFRDRYAHLAIFLKNIHIFLKKQNIEYRIFIIEQTNGKPFNRAALMNVGYLEALKLFLWNCFIFHDVDLLPLDERNLYTCPRQPRHMSVAIDTFGYRLPYKNIFGGVSAMTREHFSIVNGFSNSFFGWGGEDDDMSNRLKHANLFISRYPVNIARYMMLRHQKERANPKRFENLVNGAHKFKRDGLNSIRYEIYSKKEFPLFTWFLAELKNSEPKCQS